MILVRYKKTEGAAYLSHLELLRCFCRTISRAKLKVNYSLGFNPHMLLYFSQPLPLGIRSECELCCIDTQEEPLDFMRRFNGAAFDGISITGAVKVDRNINPAGIATASEYTFFIEGIGNYQQQLIELFSKSALIATIKDKPKDIRSLIYFLELSSPDTLTAVLAVGGSNLRADTFMDFVCRELSIVPQKMDILRTCLYTGDQDSLKEIFSV